MILFDMMKKILFENIDFADSEFHSIAIHENSLKLTLLSWNSKEIVILFSDAIQFIYKLGDVTQQVVEVVNGSDFLNEALTRNYEIIPADHPYHLFQIIDINDYPYIEIVATNVNHFN